MNSSVYGLLTGGLVAMAGSLAFGEQGAPFGGQQFAAGEGATGVELGDVDGDGFLDVVVARNVSGGFSVLMGDGSGRFELSSITETEPRSTIARLADLNGDGNLDVVLVGNTSAGALSVYEGRGDGTFGERMSFDIPNANEILLEDVTGDGRIDIVATTTSNDGQLVVAPGTGGASIGFEAPILTPIGDIPTRLQVADVNTDGIPDAVVTSNSPNVVNVLINDGAAGFSPAPGSPLAMPTPTARGFVVADLDGDGNEDIAVAAFGGTLLVYLGDGTGGFGAPLASPVTVNVIGSLVAGDFTGDGIADLLGTSTVNDGFVLLAGLGGGTYADPVFFGSGDGTSELAIGDVNGDLTPDAVAINLFADDITVHIGTADPTAFTTARRFAVGVTPVDVIAGDITSDGVVDLLTANLNSGSLSLLEGTGGGGFAPAADVAANLLGGPSGVAAADFDGDGLLDVAVADLGGTRAVVLRNDPARFVVFTELQELSSGGSPIRVAAGDVNGDRTADVVVIDLAANTATVHLNFDATFTEGDTVPVANEPRDIELIDLNGDGALDLVVAGAGGNGGPSGVSVSLGDGLGGFGAPSTVFSGSVVANVAVGDANVDGRPDLAVGDLAGTVAALLGNGDGTFAAPQQLETGTNPIGVALSDVDGDGDDDVTTIDTGSGATILHRSRGDGSFEAPVRIAAALGQDAPFAEPGRPQFLTSEDVNADGRADILIPVAAAEFPGGVSVALAGADAVVPCPGDTNGDNTVGPDDLFQVLANFGEATANGAADGDVTGPNLEPDGQVGPDDLFFVLANFGINCV